MQPTMDAIAMAFVASRIEPVASHMNLGYREVIERMDKVGMTDRYIYPCYRQLHSESRDNLTESPADTLLRCEKGCWIYRATYKRQIFASQEKPGLPLQAEVDSMTSRHFLWQRRLLATHLWPTNSPARRMKVVPNQYLRQKGHYPSFWLSA